MGITADLLLRWAHLFPAIVLVGGAVGGRLLGQGNVAPYARGAVIAGIFTMFTSGLLSMIRLGSSVPKGWHMWFGIKVLLALHVFTMIFLLTKTDASQEKRKRWQISALIGTALAVLVAGYMRQLRGV